MIKTENFEQLDWSDRNGGNVIGFPEIEALQTLVDEFSKKMKKKLIARYLDGYEGWDELDFKDIIFEKLKKEINKKDVDYIDVANFAAMLWNMKSA